MTDMKRWRGLRALVTDAVEQGASAIERVHLQTARRPFVVLEHIPGVSGPAHILHQAHDTIVSGVYDAIRVTNRIVGQTLDAALEIADAGQSEDAPPAAAAGGEPPEPR